MQIARSCTDERRCGDFESCETQLLELVSLNSVVHFVSAVFVFILL